MLSCVPLMPYLSTPLSPFLQHIHTRRQTHTHTQTDTYTHTHTRMSLYHDSTLGLGLVIRAARTPPPTPSLREESHSNLNCCISNTNWNPATGSLSLFFKYCQVGGGGAYETEITPLPPLRSLHTTTISSLAGAPLIGSSRSLVCVCVCVCVCVSV